MTDKELELKHLNRLIPFLLKESLSKYNHEEMKEIYKRKYKLECTIKEGVTRRNIV